MKVITLRNIPPAVAQRIEERAARTGLSLNKTVIRMLEESFDLVDGAPLDRHGDLDDLAGSWTDEDAREFDRVLAEQRRVDAEMWE